MKTTLVTGFTRKNGSYLVKFLLDQGYVLYGVITALIQKNFDYLRITEKIVIDENLFRPKEVYEIYGDNSKAKEILGWDYDYLFFEIIDILLNEKGKTYG